ncbi:MAG: 23S rRNA (adenine(2503)-C(2))-methyltransferase RlmN [Alphaproteobacteria bacterium]|nr:MAG: 23S rRNA (adenine(2503)-C(2))-methyltransferase RlmN [Alphaproteobacteria bacterium]
MAGCTTALIAPDTAFDGRKNLIGKSLDELVSELASHDLPRFRAKQLWHWIYHRGAKNFEGMTDLAKPVRDLLAKHYVLDRPQISMEQISNDGTRKWLLRLPDGNEIESVFIPDDDRGTLCVSSQVGCTLTCKFCHTGTQKLVRNLTPGEILAQIMVCRDSLGEWPSPMDGRLLSNIVMMGMGEPLYNFDNVKQALHIVMDSHGISLSKRKITLSTSGVVPMMQKCGEEIGTNLAVSLHAVRDDVRNILVPLNKKYPIKDLLQACKDYPGANNARRITFEYVMLKGVNDSAADARELVRLIKDMPSKVNLIPFNPWPGTDYECSDWEVIQEFSEIVYQAGISAPIRTPRGRDILAACGQLKSESTKLRASERIKLEQSAASA